MSFRTDQKKDLLARLREQRERLAPAATLPPALLAADAPSACFTPAIRTLLCVAAQTAPAACARLRELAPRHRAHVGPGGGGFLLASCRRPRDALALAAALHRSEGCERLGIALVTGPCQVASAAASDADFIVLPGAERVRAEALAAQAAPGAVQVSRETFHALGDRGGSDFMPFAEAPVASAAATPPAAAPASNWAALLS